MEAPGWFLRTLGVEAALVRKMVIDLDHICLPSCDSTAHYPGRPVTHNRGLFLVDFTLLLRLLYDSCPHLSIESLQHTSAATPPHDDHAYPPIKPPSYREPIFNTEALTKIIRALRESALKIKKYSQMLDFVHIRYDELGSQLKWGSGTLLQSTLQAL